MQLRNLTRKAEIVSHEKFLRTIWEKATGLMFSKKIEDTAYVFVFSAPTKVSLHMLFVFFRIDVLFLDSELKVLDLKEMFLPFTFYSSNARSSYVIELPEGSIKRSKTRIGDKIYLKQGR
jgi:uncharacterized protein